MQRFLSFLAGVLTGALVGATIAVLLAPAPGTTTREDLRNRVLTLKDEMKSAAESRRVELENQLTQLRTPVE